MILLALLVTAALTGMLCITLMNMHLFPRLRAGAAPPHALVSILIPARNEETHIAENKATVHGEVIHQSSPADDSTGTADMAEPEIKPSPGDVIEKPSEAVPESTENPVSDEAGETANLQSSS